MKGIQTVIGLVLAAGQGQRLRPDTDALPKTLLAVDGELTILDVILRNLAKAGAAEVAIVAGYAADAIIARVPVMRARHGIDITIVTNDRYDRNNAYSLWLARDVYADGALLVNGDTVHPVEVEQTLLAAAGTEAGPADQDGPTAPAIHLALDVTKALTDEAMKVTLTPAGTVDRITKQMPVETATGEYIGATLIGPAVAADLAEALHETWRRDATLYYEDGFQLLADQGTPVGVAPLPPLDWVEVDDHADLARARELACRC